MHRLIALAIFPTLSLLLAACPAIMDGKERIANGYSISFTSSDGIFIAYEGTERPKMIVIGARVDGFKVIEHRIYVARTPMELYKDGDSLSYRIQDKCEHWVIDSKRPANAC